MARDNPVPEAGPDDLVMPFVFVPRGENVPWEVMAGWGEILRIPATMVPRNGGAGWNVQLDFNGSVVRSAGEPRG